MESEKSLQRILWIKTGLLSEFYSPVSSFPKTSHLSLRTFFKKSVSKLGDGSIASVTFTRIRWDREGQQLSKYDVVCIRPHPWWDTKFWIRLANKVCTVADFPGQWRSRHKQWACYLCKCSERKEGGRGRWLVLRWDRSTSGAQLVTFKLPARLRQEK